MNERGLTMIEMIVVVAIVGILANIAVPAASDMRLRADAASVIADFNTIRAAAFDHYAETGTFPNSEKAGQVPAELVASLPGGFSFQHGEVSYRWRRWSLPNGLPKKKSQKVLVGVEIKTKNKALMEKIKALYRGQVAFGKKDKITFVIL